MVKLSDDELEFMTGSREPAGRAPLWHDGLRLVTLSRGSAGSTWFTATAQNDVPTFKVAAVDTTGAGDGFMAGLIAGLLAEPEAPDRPARLDRHLPLRQRRRRPHHPPAWRDPCSAHQARGRDLPGKPQ